MGMTCRDSTLILTRAFWVRSFMCLVYRESLPSAYPCLSVPQSLPMGVYSTVRLCVLVEPQRKAVSGAAVAWSTVEGT